MTVRFCIHRAKLYEEGKSLVGTTGGKNSKELSVFDLEVILKLSFEVDELKSHIAMVLSV